jgi:hypothetical protein
MRNILEGDVFLVIRGKFLLTLFGLGFLFLLGRRSSGMNVLPELVETEEQCGGTGHAKDHSHSLTL